MPRFDDTLLIVSPEELVYGAASPSSPEDSFGAEGDVPSFLLVYFQPFFDQFAKNVIEPFARPDNVLLSLSEAGPGETEIGLFFWVELPLFVTAELGKTEAALLSWGEAGWKLNRVGGVTAVFNKVVSGGVTSITIPKGELLERKGRGEFLVSAANPEDGEKLWLFPDKFFLQNEVHSSFEGLLWLVQEKVGVPMEYLRI